MTPKSVPSGRQSIAAIVALRAAFELPRGWSIEPETSTMITSARSCGIGTTTPAPPPAGHGDDGVDLGAIAWEVLVLKDLARRRCSCFLQDVASGGTMSATATVTLSCPPRDTA